MGGEDFCRRYQERLEAELDEAYASFSKHNDGKNIFYAARTPAALFALMFVMYVVSLVTGFVGIGSVAALCNLVMGAALAALCVWAYVKYSGEFREVGGVIDLVAETLWEQVSDGLRVTETVRAGSDAAADACLFCLLTLSEDATKGGSAAAPAPRTRRSHGCCDGTSTCPFSPSPGSLQALGGGSEPRPPGGPGPGGAASTGHQQQREEEELAALESVPRPM